ncbi:hypothetical protein N182_37530 [Sinorhizobium sp. GL2]|nr:hypothetical protein N182_37530 [Sinorhizobium sp. GL2]
MIDVQANEGKAMRSFMDITMRRLSPAISATLSILTIVGSVQASELVIMSSGGGFDEAMRKTVVEPFIAGHPDVTVIFAPPAYAAEQIVKFRASQGRSGVDLSMVAGGWQIQAINDGSYENIDPAKVSNIADLYPGTTMDGNYGPAIAMGRSGLAYLPAKAPKEPTSWEQLWDPAFKGHVAIPNPTHTAGLMLIDYIRRQNGDDCGDDDATFARLAQLKAQEPMFYNLATQVRDGLANGSIWLAVNFDSQISLLVEAGVDVKFVVPTEGALANPMFLNIVKGTGNKDLANEFINYYIAPETQKRWAQAVYYGPTNRLTKLEPPLANSVAYGEAGYAALKMPDWACIQKSQSRWADRWNREVLEAR